MTRTPFYLTLLLGVVMVGLFCAPSSHAQVYKKVLEDGTVVYTDKKEAGAEEVQVESVVSEFEPVKRATDGAITTGTESADEEGDDNVQASIAITSPAHEATIRSNEGIVNVTWAAQTRNVKGRLNYQLWVDNQLTYEGPSAGVTLRDMNRGEHRLRVRLFDESGTELAVSDTLVIFIHQASIYNPALNSGNSSGNSSGNVNMGGTSGQN
ncbi:DUF4124 domain-containing protein [Pseudidiomarina homiensis]|uniref:DUF4124 domain-containing protein n=1 Tax=Pseudidiomarina homiensis TaxID=364198 RepID=A0A432XXL2_9GAMM|nr:DUF4124 domain-containing protein [Pseudidiomarina homiensis]RUO53456.1 hypothetical protein CWI70_09740 [Pseudidiomarina homiensis]